MIKNNIVKYGILHALGTAAYIVLVATFLSHAQDIFGPEEPKSVLVPIMMLSLLVFSAAMVGLLLLGRPILWYWDGKKPEAVSLVIHTMAAFFVVVLIAIWVVYSFL
ncbi:MAG: hypothetical protein AAB455_01470 [Patescibacteria group bacterium]